MPGGIVHRRKHRRTSRSEERYTPQHSNAAQRLRQTGDRGKGGRGTSEEGRLTQRTAPGMENACIQMQIMETTARMWATLAGPLCE